ncbi:hypothetical protein GMOD_00004267 [Pyrenophora seminiperda CCB06]|uniref:Uncharacterized protein n=1 Tax=Pyrenophora seminiperda CCB06 TaxID=1302712 RepID=A0A3M7M0W9_9PLEO|nr:hypothetical protein GMOD_00004267 [Pyrenophora seminiperda CCB06]
MALTSTRATFKQCYGERRRPEKQEIVESGPFPYDSTARFPGRIGSA